MTILLVADAADAVTSSRTDGRTDGQTVTDARELHKGHSKLKPSIILIAPINLLPPASNRRALHVIRTRSELIIIITFYFYSIVFNAQGLKNGEE